MTPHFLQQLRFHLDNFETEARDEIERFLAHVEPHFQLPAPAVPGPVAQAAAPAPEPTPQPTETPQEAAPAATEADSTQPAEEQSHG